MGWFGGNLTFWEQKAISVRNEKRSFRAFPEKKSPPKLPLLLLFAKSNAAPSRPERDGKLTLPRENMSAAKPPLKTCCAAFARRLRDSCGYRIPYTPVKRKR